MLKCNSYHCFVLHLCWCFERHDWKLQLQTLHPLLQIFLRYQIYKTESNNTSESRQPNFSLNRPQTCSSVCNCKLTCQHVTSIYLFCLEPEAVSCCPLSAALPPPALDTCSPVDHERQGLLSRRRMHQLPVKVEGEGGQAEDHQMNCSFLQWSASYLTLFKTEHRCRFEFLSTAVRFSECFWTFSCENNSPEKIYDVNSEVRNSKMTADSSVCSLPVEASWLQILHSQPLSPFFSSGLAPHF